MVCAKCGTNLPNDARFCSACGEQLGAPPGGRGFQSGGGIHIDSDGRGAGRGYKYEVLHSGAFALALIQLETEQSIQAEAGAMVSMSGNVELLSQMKGG
jgi:Double zinc ribbon/Mitochondrial biogenesis AIM24